MIGEHIIRPIFIYDNLTVEKYLSMIRGEVSHLISQRKRSQSTERKCLVPARRDYTILYFNGNYLNEIFSIKWIEGKGNIK